MKAILSNILKVAISLGLGIFIAWWTFSKLDDDGVHQLKDAFHRANYFWLILGPAIGMLSNSVRALRWQMMLNAIGYKPKFGNINASVFIMYVGNTLFPRLGEVTRCSILYKTDEVPIEKSIGTMVVERAVDMVTMLLIGVVLIFFQYDLLYDFFAKNILAHYATSLSSLSGSKVLLLLFTIAILGGLMVFFVFKKMKDNPIIQKITALISGVLEGLASIRNLPNPLLFIFYSILIWAMYFLMIYVSFWALPETAGLGIYAGLACVFFGGFAFILTQGGVGAYPVTIREVLGLYLIAAPIGLAFGWLVWALQTLMVLVSGLIAILYLFFEKKNK